MSGSTRPTSFTNVTQLDQLNLTGNPAQDRANIYGAVEFVMDERSYTAEDRLRVVLHFFAKKFRDAYHC